MDTDLTPDQEAEAQRIFAVLKRTSEADLISLARLLASKADRDLLGATEFAVRDRVLRIGAQALETALQERKKGAMTGRAAPARTARRRRDSTAGSPGGS
jgi:hypothetical protein